MNFSQLSFGTFHVKIFGFFATIAFAWGIWTWWTSLRKNGQDLDFFAHHFWRWMLTGLFFGRLGAFFLDSGIRFRQGWLGIFEFWDGGFNAFIALLSGLGVFFWDMHRNKKNAMRWLDLAVVPFLASLLLLDIGGFLTGAWYGSPTSLPWGVSYNTFGVELVEAVHPVTLYALVLHFVLLQWAKRKKTPWQNKFGQLTVLAGGGWAIIDGFLQLFFRGDPSLMVGPVRVMGAVSLLSGIFIIVWRWQKGQK